MRRLLFLLALLFALPAHAEGTGASAAGQLAAGAVVSMHNAVIRDVLGSDFEFTSVLGNEAGFMLYADADERVYLLVSLDEESRARAEIAVLQAYDIEAFRARAALSLEAIALPFLKDEEKAAFDAWLAAQMNAVEAAYAEGADYELDYYEGEYVACAASAYHEDGRVLLTLLARWYQPLTADDITLLMED